MGTTYRFLAMPDEAPTVLGWFRALPDAPVEGPAEPGTTFWFSRYGPLGSTSKDSPVVSVFSPRRKWGVLTTVGEVHFLSTPLSRFPQLAKVNRQFANWLRQYPCVFSQRADSPGEWDYYLEGGVRNWDTEIHALPKAMSALQNGSYFVSDKDNDHVLQLVCRKLELRGVEGIEAG